MASKSVKSSHSGAASTSSLAAGGSPPAVSRAISPANVAPHAAAHGASQAHGHSPSVPLTSMTVRQRKAAREEADRLAKQEEMDLHQMKSYNEMMKSLLAKEIAAREVAEGKVAQAQADLETFKTAELEALKSRHSLHLQTLEVALQTKFRQDQEAVIESAVLARLQAQRQKDAQRMQSLADVQQKLQVEYEEKYAQRLGRADRTIRELNERLSLSQGSLSSFQSEQKSYQTTLSTKDGTIRALEHRVHILEKFKIQLKLFKTLFKYLSVRCFVNSCRLKKHLTSVTASLVILNDKLQVDSDYDRTSDQILPQHELASWVEKAQDLLNHQRMKSLERFNQVFAGTSLAIQGGTQQQQHNVISALRPISASTTVVVVPPSPIFSPTQQSPLSSPMSKKKSMNSQHNKFMTTVGPSAAVFLRPMGSSTSGGKDESKSPYSMNHREMLQSLSEVELVLRPCLIECLQRNHEWKHTSSDFFQRNQDLVSELIELKSNLLQSENEREELKHSKNLLEKSLNLNQNNEQVQKMIEAQAPSSSSGGIGNGRMNSNSSNSSTTTTNTATKNMNQSTHRLQGLSIIENHRNSSDRPFIQTQTQNQGGEHHHVSGQDDDVQHQAQTQTQTQTQILIDSHRRTLRLKSTSPFDSKAILDLSSQDLRDLSSPKVSKGRGVFDHHHALLKACITQKQQLEAYQRSDSSLREKVKTYKRRLELLREQGRFENLAAEGMDLEVDQAEQSDNEDGAEEQHEQDSYPSTPSPDRAQSPISSPRSNRRSGAGGGPRPIALELNDDEESRIRTTHGSNLYSPPVYPVSPYAPARSMSSASNTGGSGSGGASLVQTPVNAGSYHAPVHLGHSVDDYPMTAERAPPSSTRTGRPQSPYTRPSTAGVGRASNARSTWSHGAQILTQALADAPTTSSQSYAGTSVYAPPAGLFPSGPIPVGRSGAERVYAQQERPKTTSGLREHFSRSSGGPSRTVNPLLAAGLASPTTVAAALTARNGPRSSQNGVHHSNVVTNDVRYDILSPYVAAPLPWEVRDKRMRYSDRAPLSPRPTVDDILRDMKRKSAVPRQVARPKSSPKHQEEKRQQTEEEEPKQPVVMFEDEPAVVPATPRSPPASYASVQVERIGSPRLQHHPLSQRSSPASPRSPEAFASKSSSKQPSRRASITMTQRRASAQKTPIAAPPSDAAYGRPPTAAASAAASRRASSKRASGLRPAFLHNASSTPDGFDQSRSNAQPNDDPEEYESDDFAE